jgi:membrane protease YdiL (CAAX protease family)
VFAVAWGVRALLDGRFFPPQRHRAVPWSDNEPLGWFMIACLFGLVLVFEPNYIVHPFLETTGFFGRLPELKAPAAQGEGVGETDGNTGEEDARARQDKAGERLRQMRDGLWTSLFAFPLQVGTILGLVWLTSGLRPYCLGWTAGHWPQCLVVGFLGWLVLTPAVLTLHVAVQLLYNALVHIKPEQHPLTRLLYNQPPVSESILVVLTAVIAAPIVEELLFRGLLQPWFSRRWQSGLAGMAIALVLSYLQRAGKTATAWKVSGFAGAVQELWAPAFVLAMIPGYFAALHLGAALAGWKRKRDRLALLRADTWRQPPAVSRFAWPEHASDSVTAAQTSRVLLTSVPPDPQRISAQERLGAGAAAGIYASALLFAAVHSFAWPSPVSLFVLALGLGYLRYRTQSLVAPIVLHALFNGISCVYLLLQPAPAPKEEKGKETTSAVRFEPAASNSTMVPGSWLPRRMNASPMAPSRGDIADDVTWPTSLPSRKSFVPASARPSGAKRKPRRVRLTWPRSRAMTIGSCPRKQPFL